MIEKSVILEYLTNMLIDVLEVEKKEVKPTSLIMKDLSADSLDFIDIIMQIEKKYSIAIEDEDITAPKKMTVQMLVDVIKKYLDKKYILLCSPSTINI